MLRCATTRASSQLQCSCLAPAGAAALIKDRPFSTEGKLDAGAEEVAELLEGSIDRSARITKRPPLLTTRREALSLYREVLRHSRLFVWRDANGRQWGEVIRESARKEFEAARVESDPELINRMIITGREAVQRAVEAFMSKRDAIIAEEEAAVAAGRDPFRQDASRPPGPPPFGGALG